MYRDAERECTEEPTKEGYTKYIYIPIKIAPYPKQMKNSKVEKVSFRQTQQEPTVSKNTERSPAVCTFCYVLRMACLQMSPANKMIEV